MLVYVFLNLQMCVSNLCGFIRLLIQALLLNLRKDTSCGKVALTPTAEKVSRLFTVDVYTRQFCS